MARKSFDKGSSASPERVVQPERKVRPVAPKPVVPKTVTLASTRNHNVEISYGGESMIIPPKGKVTGLNKEKLGAIPKGIQIY